MQIFLNSCTVFNNTHFLLTYWRSLLCMDFSFFLCIKMNLTVNSALHEFFEVLLYNHLLTGHFNRNVIYLHQVWIHLLTLYSCSPWGKNVSHHQVLCSHLHLFPHFCHSQLMRFSYCLLVPDVPLSVTFLCLCINFCHGALSGKV